VKEGFMEIPQNLLQRYVSRRSDDVNDCLSFIENKNFEQLEKLGHQFKGSALTFGFQDLSSIGRELESAAQERDQKKCLTAVMAFRSWLKNRD
jgi:HPt (histidine-containing phosphotransfer) domain-containing protein